jgi:septum formation protein
VLEPIVLASGSKQRQDFFKMLGIPFSIMPPDIDESNMSNLPPDDFVRENARRKALKVEETLAGRTPPWIFAADTVIALQEGDAAPCVIGKAETRSDAGETLRLLRGKTHRVITGMALFSGSTGKTDLRSVASEVEFAPMTDAEVEWYLDTGEWQGAAGCYRVLGRGACFIKEIRGSWSCVVGLPLRDFRLMLLENGYKYE